MVVTLYIIIIVLGLSTALLSCVTAVVSEEHLASLVLLTSASILLLAASIGIAYFVGVI